jgi:6-phosphogluconate dehydrogenase (decarboxylating)
VQIGMIGFGRNGIEYGLMQAYAEGFDILLNARSMDLSEQHRYDLSLRDIAEVWRRGSVVPFRSRPDHSFERVLSAMRHEFGGHVDRPSGG